MTRRICIALLATIVWAAAVPASASDDGRCHLGPNHRVTYDAGDEMLSSVSFNPTANEYVVVWIDSRTQGGPSVWGRRMAPDGTRIGAEFRVSGSAAVIELPWRPAIAYDPLNDIYLVVWTDARNATLRGTDVYAQRLAADGTRVGTNIRVSGAGGVSGDWAPDVSSGAGSFFVVWSAGRLTNASVYGRRVPAGTGGTGSTDVLVSGPASAAKAMPAVAYHPVADRYLVVWEDLRNAATTKSDVYGQLVDVVGGAPVRIGPNLRISLSGAVGDDWHVDAAALDGSPQFLVVWSDGRFLPVGDRVIYGQRVAIGGGRLGINLRVSGGAASGVLAPSVAGASGAEHRWLVSWIDARNALERGSDVYAQVIGGGGNRLDRNVRVSGRGAVGSESTPAVAGGPVGEWLVTWHDSRHAAIRGWDVYGQPVPVP